MSDVAQMWWSVGSTGVGLALVWSYTRWDRRRFMRDLEARRSRGGMR